MSTAFIKHNELSVVLFMDQILKPSQSCASSSPTSDRRILSGKKFGPFVRSVRSVCSGPFGPFLFGPIPMSIRSVCSIRAVSLFGSIRSLCSGPFGPFVWVFSGPFGPLFWSIRSVCSGPFGPFVWVFSGPFGPFVLVHSVSLFGSIRSVCSICAVSLFGPIRSLCSNHSV